MEQTTFDSIFISNDALLKIYYDDIVKILNECELTYDTSLIKIEHRTPEKSEDYDAIVIINTGVFYVKGKKTQYLYFNNTFEKLLNKYNLTIEPSIEGRWARIDVKDFPGFANYKNELEELYEDCLMDSDRFGCCSDYMKCSDAGKCVKSDIMFIGKCSYRLRLKEGKIFYGKNKNA